MATPKIYKTCDIELAKLKADLKRQINKLSVLPIDQLNIIGLKSETKKLMTELQDRAYTSFLLIALAVHDECVKLLSSLNYASKMNRPNEEYVREVLKRYNILTGYLFFPEAERKRMRLVEEILTAKEYNNIEQYEQAIRKFGNLWWTQLMAYGNAMVDAEMLDMYKSAGVEWVRWEAEDDDKTCHICEDLNQIVFKLKDLPDKPHRNCRCWYTPMPKGYKP